MTQRRRGQTHGAGALRPKLAPGLLWDFNTGDPVIWWKQVTADRETPTRGVVLGKTGKRIRIGLQGGRDRAERVVRYVAAEHLQPVGRYCAKAPSQGRRLPTPMSSWGQFTRYVEVGEDLFCVRHVDVFDNGNVLSYDREPWVDAYGMLGEARVNRNRTALRWGKVEEIVAEEFERIWARALRHPLRKQQIASALMPRHGLVPVWLSISRSF